jgi:hypothetical protein
MHVTLFKRARLRPLSHVLEGVPMLSKYFEERRIRKLLQRVWDMGESGECDVWDALKVAAELRNALWGRDGDLGAVVLLMHSRLKRYTEIGQIIADHGRDADLMSILKGISNELDAIPKIGNLTRIWDRLEFISYGMIEAIAPIANRSNNRVLLEEARKSLRSCRSVVDSLKFQIQLSFDLDTAEGIGKTIEKALRELRD